MYDVSHMGHARAYLTFDILRRVMEDYFGYSVHYVMNVTDIDDKIILRARRNALLAEYEKENAADQAKVAADAVAAAEAASAKQAAKLAELRSDESVAAAAAAGTRAAAERVTAEAEAAFKAEQAAGAAAAAKAAADKGDAAAALAAGRDALAERLDAEKGDTITDHAVFERHARYYEREFLSDLAALGVPPPDVLPRVTEYVPQVVAFIQQVVDRKLAYESNGSVYFDTAAFGGSHDYRKLVPAAGANASAREMAEGEGALASAAAGEKRSPNDFVLWKRSKRGEPAWESPWGQGRPGWHIECSVMATDIIGDNMDIHAGGSDLKFPHHDNEMAQSEAYHGNQQWVNYFLHAGHLHIRGLKMSKSLKNFVTIRQALQEHSSRQLRMMFLLQAWDKPCMYSDQVMGDAKAKEALFKNFFGAVKALLRDDWASAPQVWRKPDHAMHAALEQAQRQVHAALCDNIDTPGAIAALCELVTEANKYLTDAANPPRALLMRRVGDYVTRILRVFGLVAGGDELGFGRADAGAASGEAAAAPFVNVAVAFRDKIRDLARAGASAGEMLAACDALRDGAMAELGVRVEDRAGQPSLWKMDDPAELQREIAEKKAVAAEAAAKKKANKIALLEKELAKAEAAAVPPVHIFRTAAAEEKYGAWDDKGVPKALKSGEELNKSQQKAVAKEWTKQDKAHSGLVKKAGDAGVEAYLEKMRADIAALKL